MWRGCPPPKVVPYQAPTVEDQNIPVPARVFLLREFGIQLEVVTTEDAPPQAWLPAPVQFLRQVMKPAHVSGLVAARRPCSVIAHVFLLFVVVRVENKVVEMHQ